MTDLEASRHGVEPLSHATVNRIHESAEAPIDEASAHLTGMVLPEMLLTSTARRTVNLATTPGMVVVYCYPRTSRPGEPPPTGWDEIPGARGCTPQSCAFRDHHAEVQALGATVFGVSTQTTAYQQEAVERLHLPFELLSDADLTFATALRLPIFEIDGMTLIRRVTLVISDGRIEHVFHPVPAPAQNAEDVIAWLRANPGCESAPPFQRVDWKRR